MHIISLKMLRDFWKKHQSAEAPLRNWHSITEKTRFADMHHLKRVFNGVDYSEPYTIFNVGGNNYRVIALVYYPVGKVYIRYVFTHREYDDWCKQHRQGKG